MTLAPPNFSFPSTATTIVKMEVDHRWIGVEGLEFGVVKTKMVLELEVVETGDIKKLKRWWWVLVMIEGKLVVINGDSGRHLPRAAIAWWLYFNSLFFSVKRPKKRRKWQMKMRNWKDESGNLFKFRSVLTWRLGCYCRRKIRKCQGRHSSTSVHCCRHHCS